MVSGFPYGYRESVIGMGDKGCDDTMNTMCAAGPERDGTNLPGKKGLN
jgi:hypothetical protein